MNSYNQIKNITKIHKNIFTLMDSSKYNDFYFINSINIAEVMGAGLTKGFKKHKPNHFQHYKTNVEKVFVNS